VGVLNAGVHAHAPGRWEAVRAVAYQEHTTDSVALGDLRGHGPHARVAHQDLDVAATDRGTYELFAALGRIVGFELSGGIERVHEHPRLLDVVGDEGSGSVGVEQPIENRRPLGDERAEIRLEVNHDEALQAVRPDHLDAERPAHATRRAVGGKHVTASHGVASSARQIADARRNPALVLL
jgi:hypothetical protein